MYLIFISKWDIYLMYLSLVWYIMLFFSQRGRFYKRLRLVHCKNVQRSWRMGLHIAYGWGTWPNSKRKGKPTVGLLYYVPLAVQTKTAKMCWILAYFFFHNQTAIKQALIYKIILELWMSEIRPVLTPGANFFPFLGERKHVNYTKNLDR